MNAHAARILSKLREIHENVRIMATCESDYEADMQVVQDIADVIELCEDVFSNVEREHAERQEERTQQTKCLECGHVQSDMGAGQKCAVCGKCCYQTSHLFG
tara:strand:+ start:8534 stop:8839 length:306 start_codon:yes stop_codon:yes gene_type:complete